MKEIKILGNDKQIYKVNDFISEGKNHKDGIGIIFGAPLIGLRLLALDSYIAPWSGNEDVQTESVCESQAIQILCGLNDTKRIVESQKNLNILTAAKWCWDYQKGNYQWYLPSLMELGALFLVRNQINNAIRQIGGDLLVGDYYYEDCVWSSSKYSHNDIWCIDFSDGSFSLNNNDFKLTTRAVTVFTP